MKINKADVAELVDARDLKSSGHADNAQSSCKILAGGPVETDRDPAHLQNIFPLPDCIRHLKAMRLPLATTLAQQLENYERDPKGMRPKILLTIGHLER